MRTAVPVVCAALALATLAVFAPALHFGFANLDDPAYVSANRHVLRGLSWEGIAWAFTTTEQSNWHPLTWISLMLDAELFGPGAAGFHRTNVALHVLNVLLVFVVLLRMTGCLGKSAAVAGLFGVHPLHVESVVWIAERKDVLSTLFLLLALGAHAGPAERRGAGRLLLVAALFVLGLLSKPMLVSFPLLLLLIDFWPLGRGPEGWRHLVREKAFLFGASLVSCGVTLAAQHAGGALRPFERYPLDVRAANAAVSCVAYLGKTLWPADLAIYYPHPHEALSPWAVAGSIVLLAAVTAGTLRLARSLPFLVVGWLWYVVSLLPVIGIVQVGGQAMADRYTYVPLLGIFVAGVWGIVGLAGRGWPRRALLSAIAALVVVLGGRARTQVGYWETNEGLFEHALQVTRDNALAENCLANALFRKGRYDAAIEHYREAVRISPAYADAHGNLAAALLNRGSLDEAEGECRTALRLDPAHVRSRINLAIVLTRRGRLDEAAASLEQALRITSDLPDARRYLAAIRAQQGRLEEALAETGAALAIDPEDAEARKLLEAIRAEISSRAR